MPFDPPAVGEIAVAGVLGDPGNGFGGIPVTLLSNIVGAVEMRFGSTPEELALTEWRTYSAETPLWMRTGGGERIIYAEFRDELGNVTSVETTVPPFDELLGTDYQVPTNSALQLADSENIWEQHFSDGHDAWATYDYNGGDPNGSNVFYAASWSSTGGVGGGSYVWSDSSRWRIDTPEVPVDVLPLLTYSQWALPDNLYVDLNGTTVEFYLRSEGLDLKGAHADFWILDDDGRWHQWEIELNIGDGEWALNSIDIGYDVTAGWENSFSWAAEQTLELGLVRSWGIALVGFPEGVEPTGVLGIDEFTISRRSMNVAGTAGNDTLVGGRGDDTITAGDGADSLTGAEGADHLEGGLGDDDYYAEANDTIVEPADGGFDIVHTTQSHQLSDNVEAALLLGSDGLTGTGTAFANWIYGDLGNDTLQGLAGNDLLDGGAGDDVLEGGEDADWLRGGAGLDHLVGGDGTDTLDGGADQDLLEGGLGHDIYYVTADDVVAEALGGGTDLVISAISWTLGDNVESLRLTGTASGLTGTGNAVPNVLQGSEQNDVLLGLAGADHLQGNDGNDWLVGGADGDLLEGGLGNDGYWIEPGDTIVETADGGHDIAHIEGSFSLPFGVEAVYMTGTAAVSGVGNSEANWIYSTAGNDTLESHEGADLLDGGEGNDLLDGGADSDWLRGGPGQDHLLGGSGIDRLDGGADQDALEGGLGDDIYDVTLGDVIVEATDAGTDLVYSEISWTLAANVENLRLTGSAAGLIGSGNEFANRLYGTAQSDTLYGYDGDDFLDGGAGNDILNGGQGNDRYWIQRGDAVVEAPGGGFDIVYIQDSFVLSLGIEAVYMEGSDDLIGLGNSEGNWIYGGTGSDFLFGYGGNDLLDGGADDDVLDGGAGDDSLRGQTGDDRFVFMDAFGHDAIRGFTTGAGSEDKIQFSINAFADFAAIQAASSSYLDGTRIVSGDDWVYLIGVDVHSLHSDDFLLV